VGAVVAGVLANRQRNLAVRERTSADRTARFMVSLFQLADPGESRGNAITVREVLDRGAADVRQSLAHEPGIRAELMTAMGQAYSGLGLYDQAAKLLEQARADQNGTDVPDESRVRTLVASGRTLSLAEQYEASEKVLREAVGIARRKLAVTDVLRSEALEALAEVLGQLERYPEAKQLCEEALAVDRRRGPDQSAVLARTLDTLGTIYFSSGDLPHAETTWREALALHEQASGLRHPLTAVSMNNLAAVLYQMGRYDDAMAMYQRAEPVYKAVYGTDHPEIAAFLNNLGRAALMAGHVDAAEPRLRQALAMSERLMGPNHDYLVPELNSLAMIDGYAGRPQRAAEEIERAAQIARLPNHGAFLDQVLLNEADLSIKENKADVAAAQLAESRRLLEAQFPIATHPAEQWRYSLWETVNAELLASEGDFAAARRTIAAAQPVIVERFGAGGFHSMLVRRREQFVDAHRPK
jgi:tetratricopeptide (TPR) repeat protein